MTELEREVQLRQAQEAALKEAVRDLQREIDRLRLAGKTGGRAGAVLCPWLGVCLSHPVGLLWALCHEHSHRVPVAWLVQLTWSA